jgi:predicted nucleotidyltransferase
MSSLTVNEAFNTFNRDYVNLDSERTKVARASRDWLLKQLIALPEKIADFPKLYESMHINFGSFARNTKIRELDDIDLLLAFSAEGTKYQTVIFGQEYVLRPPATASKLLDLCNEDGTLNSIKLINKLVSSLGEIEQYKESEMHRVQEAATLQLNSYEWCYDIVPAFYADAGYYQIPDGQGGWKATDPRIDETRVVRINKKHNGRILQLIRTLKFWNRRAMMATIPPYLFENIILNFYDATESISEYIDLNLRSFWDYLQTGIHYDVPDPKNFQGNLNTLTSDERAGIAAKACDAWRRAASAIQLEVSNHDQIAAINKWAEIFGPDFK